MTQIKLRRDTAANFTSKNPVLGVGEPAYETDTKKLKIGDGTTAYTQLEYFSAGGGGSTDITATLPLKIVDGVISLDVDGQTIQVVDGKLHANLDDKQDKFETQVPLSIRNNSITTSVDPSITDTTESWTGGGKDKVVSVDISALNIDANSDWKIHLSGYMGNWRNSGGDTNVLRISTETELIFSVWFGSGHFRLGANTAIFNQIPDEGREFYYEIVHQNNDNKFTFNGTNLVSTDPLLISKMSQELGQTAYTTLEGKGKLNNISFVINSSQFRRIDKDISKSYFEADGVRYPITSVEGINTLTLGIGSGLSVVDGKLTSTGGGITKEEVIKLVGNPQSTANRILITQTLTEEQVIVMPNNGLLIGYYGNSAHAGTAALYMSKVDANNKRLPALFSTQVIGDSNNCTTCQVCKGDRIMFHLVNAKLSDTGRNPDYGIYLFKSEDL